MGRARDKVTARCLVAVNVYDESPRALLMAIRLKMDVNIMIAGLFFCKMIENSLEINFSILLKMILFVEGILQKDVGRTISIRVILTQFVIIVLEHGSKIEKRFLIIFNLFQMWMVY